MNWKILNVSIPVKNLEVSKDFYNKLLNNELEDKLFYKNFFEDYNDDIFLGEGGFGIRLYIPKQDLENCRSKTQESKFRTCKQE